MAGSIRTLKITGTKTGTPQAIDTFLRNLYGLINGDQAIKTYHSDDFGNINVKVDDIHHIRIKGEVNHVTYDMTLMETVSY